MAWLLLHWAILPHIDKWRGTIESQASAALGLRLSIGSIQVQSGGWIPALELRDLRFSDAQAREVLHLPKVAASLSARSLLAFRLHFEQLLIEEPQLEVRRNKQGKIFVAGLSLNEDELAAADGAELADWFFSQHEFVVLRGRLRWVDESRDAPPLQLSDVDLVIRNGLRRHELRLDATPPPLWGERFALRGSFTQSLLKSAGDLRHWSGQLYASLPRTDVRELNRHVHLPFELAEGDGALRAWVDVKEGEATGATVDLALRAVNLRLSPKAQAIDLERIQGRLEMQRGSKSLSVSVKQLGFVTGDGLSWPQSDLSIRLKQTVATGGVPGPVTGGEFSAQHLDLAVLTEIGSRLPMGEALQGFLRHLRAQGVASRVVAQWEGVIDRPQSYRVQSTLKDLSFAAKASGDPLVAGRPGVQKAELQINATERGGTGRLFIKNGALEFPGVFEVPVLALDKLSAALSWRIDPSATGGPSRIELKLSEVSFSNADASGELSAEWSTGPGTGIGRGARYPGRLDMSGRLDKARASSAARYLPLQIPANARHYVRDAVRSGTAHEVNFKVRGDLWDFPYDTGQQGQFQIDLRAQDVQLAYVPSHPATTTQAAWESPWPAMDRVSANLVFDRGSMEIRNGRASIYGFELSGVRGGFKDLVHEPVLALEGSGRGPLADLLRYLRSSPVGEWTGQGLSPALGTGTAELLLALQVPLADTHKTSVKGSVTLLGNELRLRPDVPPLSQAKGRINFTHKGVSLQGVTARALGGDVGVEGGSLADGNLHFTAQGTASAEGLRAARYWPELARLAQSLNGQSGYRMELGLLRGMSELQVSSNLQGMRLDLPAPLSKEAGAVLNLRYQTQLAPELRAPLKAGRRDPLARDVLRFELGNLLQAQYQRELSDLGPRVLAGAIALQERLPALPPSGVVAVASPGSLDVDAWSALSQRVFGAEVRTDDALDSSYAPTSIVLHAREMVLGGRRLDRVEAQISRPVGASQGSEAGLWRATVDAEQMKGFVEYRDARSGASRIYARMARLSLPRSDADSIEGLLSQAPSSVPALDIVVDDFELRGKKLGKLSIEAVHSGFTREWQLRRLQLDQPDATLNATGTWKLEPGLTQRRALMDFKLSVADAGNLLERLGMGRVVRNGKGEMSGQVGWLGSPLSPDYASMNGQLSVAIDAGQFLKADPGAARLLGVLSLQSLPRRFLLDFRDLFQEGFAFDSFSGDVAIKRGMAYTNNLRMRGVSAAVLMEGQADLARESQDLRVIVVPEIGATTASLAYAAINPAIGLGTLFAQLLLRKPMAAANTREFHVTGSWSDPKVERVEHKPAAAAAASAAEASASVVQN